MSAPHLEPGTYRTKSGHLIHARVTGDLAHVEAEIPHELTLVTEDLVKLSDDPDWPDVRRYAGDPQLFAD